MAPDQPHRKQVPHDDHGEPYVLTFSGDRRLPLLLTARSRQWFFEVFDPARARMIYGPSRHQCRLRQFLLWGAGLQTRHEAAA